MNPGHQNEKFFDLLVEVASAGILFYLLLRGVSPVGAVGRDIARQAFYRLRESR